MSDADKHVFITEMPDYQEAVKKAAELSRYREPFAAAAQELGLAKELQKSKDALEAMTPRAHQLEMNQAILTHQKGMIDAQGARTAKDLALTGDLAILATGFTAGALLRSSKPKGWKILQPIAKILAVTTAAAVGWLGITHKVMTGTREAQKATRQDMIGNHANADQMAGEAFAIQNNFIETMATKMLDEQKAFSGEGAAMKLVSTAQATEIPTAASMAEKYATPPSADKAAAVAEQKAALATAHARC